MPEENEIRTIARKWVERYEEQALEEARLRIAELRRHGAGEACLLWLEIYHETRQLLASRRTLD
jgi:formamidopyrimidine-DNA glycosylase